MTKVLSLLWEFISTTRAGQAAGGLGAGSAAMFILMTYVDAKTDNIKENVDLKYSTLKEEVDYKHKEVKEDLIEIKEGIKNLNKNVLEIIKTNK